MTTQKGQRLTRRSASRALDRTASSGNERLDQLLTSSTAAPTTFELNREADTVALFRATRTLPPAPRQAFLPRLRATRFAVPAAIGVVLATGGLSFAVSAGYVPAPFGIGHSSTPHGKSAQAPGHTKPHGHHGVAGTPSASPHPSLKGLCHAYQAGATSNGGKALTNPAFSSLVKAAGGTSQVASFCAALLASPTDGPTPTGEPTGTGEPTPTGTPTHPAHPVHPTHPAHPVHPTHPPHPSASPSAS